MSINSLIMIKVSPHFTLDELCNWKKYPTNLPDNQSVINLVYGCIRILEPARDAAGCPLLVNSGFRNERVNKLVGGVPNSQHRQGCAADIQCKDAKRFQQLIEFLMECPDVDQLLTGHLWCHVSWSPWGTPRREVIINFY